jgi:hypothetical protein
VKELSPDGEIDPRRAVLRSFGEGAQVTPCPRLSAFFLERPLKGTQKKWFGSHGVTDPTAVGSLGSLYKLLGMVHSFSSPELSDRSDSVRSQVF